MSIRVAQDDAVRMAFGGTPTVHLRQRVQLALFQRPHLYHMVQTLRPSRRPLLVRPDTDIVIEGFPRCGNTFAYAAFVLAQPKELRVAHHTHSPTQILMADRYGIPCLALLRHPCEALVSALIREPNLDPILLLRHYVFFYERALKHIESIVISDFYTTTHHLDLAIRALNARFHARFVEPVYSDFRPVWAYIEELDRLDQRALSVNERTVARPSAVRAKRKAAVAELLGNLMERSEGRSALQIYETLRSYDVGRSMCRAEA